MDYLQGLTESAFIEGVRKAEQDIANANQVTDHDPYMDGLVTNPTVVTDTVKPGQPPKTSIVEGFDVEKFKPKLYMVETRNGTIKDRPGSQYSGIAQLGINERTPILKQLGITDAQYKNSIGLQKQVADIWVDGLATRLTKNGFPVNNLNVWTAHNLGVGGLNQILHGKVSKQTLSNIRNQAGMDKNSTVEDYLAHYGKIFN